MKPSENRNRDIPEMGNVFNEVLFRRKVADILRNNKPQAVEDYADEIILSFPKEKYFIVSEIERMTNQCIDLKFDDYRTPEQRQFFAFGLTNEPPMGEKMKDISQRVKTITQENEPTPLSGPDVRCFG